MNLTWLKNPENTFSCDVALNETGLVLKCTLNYIERRILKLLIASNNFALLMPDYQFFVLLCKYVLENLEESSQSQGFREGRLGYSKHNFFFFAFLLGLSLVSHRSNYF